MSDGRTFKEAYATLQKHAQALRSQQEPDIDNLTTIVGESVEAYKVCKERMGAVERALEQALSFDQATQLVATNLFVYRDSFDFALRFTHIRCARYGLFLA